MRRQNVSNQPVAEVDSILSSDHTRDLVALRCYAAIGDIMLLEADELSEILRKEQEYIDDLKKRWGVRDLSKKAEHDLRMGKRTELLGDLQQRKEQPVAVASA